MTHWLKGSPPLRTLLLLMTVVLLAGGCSAAEEIAETAREAAEEVEEEVAAATWTPADAPLMTRWADDVDPRNPHPEYPRPQMVRENWLNLNGLWDYTLPAEGAPRTNNVTSEGKILVPFALESALSGVGERSERIRYRRTFNVPSDWQDQRLLLHFGAVDWDAVIFLNGVEVGRHKGGYDAFSFDVTDALKSRGRQELVVDVFDPSDDGDQPRGKQVKDPRGIWYTPVTGIWQTVWVEPVPRAYISDFKIAPDIDRGALNVAVEVDGGAASAYQIEAVASSNGAVVGRATGSAAAELSISIGNPRLWTPDDPFLYDLELRLLRDGNEVDVIDSYFGMRKTEVGPGPDGQPRLLLNNEFVFQMGPLDQGYWPDGLYTAPTDEALRYDLEITKDLGFNMSRKHVKVEPARWYYWADRLGVLVWQDMPSADNTTPESRQQFEVELREMVDQFYNHPSIIMWIVFNEGWGQYDAPRLTRTVEEQDPTRVVMDVSGWQHMGAGDVIDVHRYPGPAAVKPRNGKASVVGEFGGVGYAVEGHTWAGEGWGYEGLMESREAYEDRYEYLLNKMWDLKDAAHMSAGVYTQITDVEVEVNGMLTYDRDIIKIDTDRAAAVNEGRTPFIQPNDGLLYGPTEVAIGTGVDGLEIRYTLDGSTPTASSQRYAGPFTLSDPATVRARAFEGGNAVSPVTTVEFRRAEAREAGADADVAEGVRYSYYEDSAEQRRPYARHWPVRQIAAGNREIDPTSTGVASGFSLDPAGRDELFAITYDGFLDVPETGVYTFYIDADDGARLYINGEAVTDRMGQSPITASTSGRIALEAGLHPFTLRYFQAYGPADLNVFVEGPGIEKQLISGDMLRHSAVDGSN